MVVVAHQHPRVNSPPRLLANPRQRLEKVAAIGVVLENRLATVPPRHHMVMRAPILDSDLTSHLPNQDDGKPNVNNNGMTPCLRRTRHEKLAARLEQTVKITVELEARSLQFLKAKAKEHRVPYQRMLRELVKSYAEACA
jgi:predicted DNA binding CopG/RHH family protein